MIEIQSSTKIQTKQGVTFNSLSPLLKLAAYILRDIYKKYSQDFTITSTTEGEHIPKSLHYTGYAFDSRTRETAHTVIEQIYTEAKITLQNLDRGFQIIVETDHIHVELDRRKT